MVEIFEVRIEQTTGQPVVLLCENNGPRCLPIRIGFPEVAAITDAYREIASEYPVTHDLFRKVIMILGDTVSEVRIMSVEQGVFHAELVFGSGIVVRSRASDAIALAIRFDSQIRCSHNVMDKFSIVSPVHSKSAKYTNEEAILLFRTFLESIEPLDFSDHFDEE